MAKKAVDRRFKRGPKQARKVQVGVTAAQYRAWCKAAKADHLTLGEYARTKMGLNSRVA